MIINCIALLFCVYGAVCTGAQPQRAIAGPRPHNIQADMINQDMRGSPVIQHYYGSEAATGMLPIGAVVQAGVNAGLLRIVLESVYIGFHRVGKRLLPGWYQEDEATKLRKSQQQLEAKLASATKAHPEQALEQTERLIAQHQKSIEYHERLAKTPEDHKRIEKLKEDNLVMVEQFSKRLVAHMQTSEQKS